MNHFFVSKGRYGRSAVSGRRLPIDCGALLIALAVAATGSADGGLVGNWRLDGAGSTAVCDVNATYDGVADGVGVVSNQPGRIGTAYAFSGGKVEIDPNGSSSPGAPAPSPLGTVSAWIKPDAGDWDGEIIYNQIPTYIQFRIESDPGTHQKHLVYRQDGGHDVIVNGPYGAIQDGVWTHVVATVTPTGIKLFVNGVENASGGGSNGYVSTDATLLRIGYGPGGIAFQGLIDDVAIWNDELSIGKIGALESILDVNGGLLGGYNAYLMESLFQVYDTGTPAVVTAGGIPMTWSKFTGGSGTVGSTTFVGGSYYVWLDASSGVTAVPEISPAGAGSVASLIAGVLGLIERRRARRTG